MEVIGGILGFIVIIVLLGLLMAVFSWATNTRIHSRGGSTITPEIFPSLVNASAQGIKKLSSESISKIRKIKGSISHDNLSKVEKLEKLNNLHLSGALDTEEYETLKREIINPNMERESKGNSSTHQYENSQKHIGLEVNLETKNSINDQNGMLSQIDSVSTAFQQQEIMEAISIINSLFYEYKNKLPLLDKYEFVDIHKLVILNKSTVSLIRSYNSLFKLYTEGIIDKIEFEEKKKQILYKSLNIERHGNI